MIGYPITLSKDGPGYIGTSGDFPELTTCGDTKEETLKNAAGALEEAIAARIAHKQDIPVPYSRGHNLVPISPAVDNRILRYEESRPRVFSGFCIGGPLAGKTVERNAPFFQHAEFQEEHTPCVQEMVTGCIQMKTTVMAHQYHHRARWVCLSGREYIQAWVHQDFAHDYAQQGLLEVIRFYKEQGR